MFKFASLTLKTDTILLAFVFPIMLAGLFTMGGLDITEPYFIRQGIWILLSLVVFFTASQFEYHFLKQVKLIISSYVVGLVLLLGLFIAGHISKGAQSWFSLGGFSFQPSDIMKLLVIIVLAKYFSRRHIEIANIRHIIVSALYAFVPFILILLQPDFGSAIVVASIWFGMVLVSGISKKHLFAVVFFAVIAFSLAWNFAFKPYQKARIMNFVHPLADIRNTGYNAYQSTIAVGSGGLVGKGLGYGTQSRLHYLPEYRTDFIFAAYAEEWGFIGSLLLLILFVGVFMRLLYFAHVAHSNFEALFTYGVIIWFMFHMIISVGMSIGIMPVTGIPLPFMSYGGSHLVAEMLALGICVGMYRYSKPIHRAHMHKEFVGLE